MDETYCAFCGVCFSVYSELYHGRLTDDDTSWTDYFVALRRGDTVDAGDGRAVSKGWYLSGVGEDIAWRGRAPQPGYDARNKDNDELTTGDHVVAYTDWNQGYEIVYPIHPACWDIFLQNHALLAKENASRPDFDTLGQLLASQSLEEGDARGLRPDWTNNYLGPEKFWADGWRHHEEPEASDVAGVLDYSAEWDFLVHDPTVFPNLDELLNNPPRVSDEQPSHLVHSVISQEDDILNLPAEILMTILCFLPTSSVRALRQASRSFASLQLSSTYWRSRFAYPNELFHVRLPSTLLSGQPGVRPIDWRTLCDMLLHPPPESQNEGWRNRKRISLLTTKLVERVLHEQPDSHLKNLAQIKTYSNSVDRQVITCPSLKSHSSASIMLDDILSSETTRTIKASFKAFGSHLFLVGLEFRGGGKISRLGVFFSNPPHCAEIQPGEVLTGLTVGLVPFGIVGLELLIRARDDPNQTRKCTFGDFNGKVAVGNLEASEGNIRGIHCGFEENGRIISIGFVESPPRSKDAQAPEVTSLISNPIWYPALPPSELNQTSSLGLKSDGEFSYRHPIIFAKNAETLCHLTRVSSFLSLEPNGVHGYQFHFDDRDSIPMHCNAQGKEVSFLIDGPGREVISALDVIWSDLTSLVGAELVTNRNRRSHFTTADVSGDLQVARHTIPVNSFVAGMFGEVSSRNGNQSAYHGFGLFWLPGFHLTSSAYTVSPADDRRFDDHSNVWTDSNPLPPDYVLGEAIGSQPTHGFINWIDFGKPIKRITACLGAHTRNFRNEPVRPSLVGLIIDIHDSEPILLGRCSSLGPFFEFDVDDRLMGFTVDVTATSRSRIITEILFNTKKNLCIGFRNEEIVTSAGEDGERRTFQTTDDLRIIGLAWSFDLGPGSDGDQGIQPLYLPIDTLQVFNASISSLYPSLVWNQPPLPGVRLRPIPEMKSTRFDFTPSVSYLDDFDETADFNLIAINVYYNSFLQGIVFKYNGKPDRVLGNKVGALASFRLYKERITAVWFYERVQKLFRMSLPREIICIDAIRFGVTKWVDGQPHQRLSPLLGCAQPFGPFMNNQRGLWDPNSGGSADWASCFKPQVTKIVLEPGTSFGGLYFEGSDVSLRDILHLRFKVFEHTNTSLQIFTRRAGVLVSSRNPLPYNLPPPAKSLNIERSGSSWLGHSPGEKYKISTVAGQAKGYRLWCSFPSSVSRARIYRHTTPEHKLVVVGLEFFCDSGQQSTYTSVLGFRSLWTEHAKDIEFESGEKITGVSFERNSLSIQSDINIFTSRSDPNNNPDQNVSRISIDPITQNVVGLFAYIEEFVEGIGMLYEDFSSTE